MFLVRAPNLFTLSGRPGLSYPDNAPILMFPKNDPNFSHFASAGGPQRSVGGSGSL